MYQSSTLFGNLIQQDSRTFRARLILGDKTVTKGIKTIRLCGGSNSADDFSIGSTASQYVEVTVENTGILYEGHEFALEIGMLADGEMEYVPMGYFTAEKPDSDEEQITVTAYDRMMKMERPCFLDLADSTDTITVLKAVGAITGVPVVTEGLTAIPMQKPVGYTCREVLSYIAQIYGGFAICNRFGQIEIKIYEDHHYTVGPGRYWNTFTHNDYPFTLEKLTCYTGKDASGEDISISVGTGAREICFSNPFMTQDMLDNIWAVLKDTSYMPGSIRFLGDPRIDPWDILTVNDRKGKSYRVPVMKLIQTFDGGLTTEVEAVGKSEAEQESGFQGPLTQGLERCYAQLVLLEHAMVNKLDADTAEITYATIENLNAVRASIQNLDVDSLTARVAAIESAYITAARVDTLLAGYARVSDLEAANAAITSLSGRFATFEKTTTEELVTAKGWMLEGSIGDAQISKVSANKLDAGTINTAVVTIVGSDGRLQIVDNTIQISDANRVRVQAGKDASGDYTLAVWDSSGKLIWDALGATENTIQRKIIRDRMVADDAAIQALKLDLQSFNTALTKQGVTISGTVVQVGNKTLNIVLSEQAQNLSQHGETLTDHTAKITANETAIRLKVDSQTYQTDKAAMTDSLNKATSDISILQGQIALKVEQTDIATAISNIRIGGRNLIKNTNTGADTWSMNRQDGAWSKSSQNMKGVHGAVINITEKSSGFSLISTRHADMLLDLVEPGTQYTISFDVYPSVTIPSTTMDIRNGNGTGSLVVSPSNIPPIPAGKWTRVSVTVTTLQILPEITFQYLYWSKINVVGTIKLCNLKMEAGNKATPWTPALEDIDSSIEAVDARFVHYSTTAQMQSAIDLAKDSITQSVSDVYATKTALETANGTITTLSSRVSAAESRLTKDSLVTTIGSYYATQSYVEGVDSTAQSAVSKAESAQTIAAQTAYKIGWIVQSGSSATDFTLTDRTASLVAQAINLGGLVTFSGLDSVAQERISEAQSTANAAKSTADSLNRIASKSYSFSGTQGRARWVRLGTLVTAGDASNFRIEVLTGNGYNGGQAQNSRAVIVIKDGYQSPKSTTAAMGVSVLRENCEALRVKVNATAHDTCTVWVYLPWDYWNGNYIISGNYTSWTHSVADQDAEPTDGTAQLVGYRTNAENAYAYAEEAKGAANTAQSTANAVNTVIGRWCYNNDKTYIDGGKLYTGSVTTDKLAANSVTADKINVNDLFAQDITATGTIKGANLVGAKGSFSGTIEASGGNIGGWYITSTRFSSAKGFSFGTTKNAVALINEEGKAFISAVDGNGAITFALSREGRLDVVDAYAKGFHIDGINSLFSDGSSVDGAFTIKNLPSTYSYSYALVTDNTGIVCFMASSSKRYKDHLSYMDESEAEKILNIPVVVFKYKDGYLAKNDQMNGKPVPGFYAEDVYNIYPVAAHLNADGLPEDWNYRAIIPPMLKLAQIEHRRNDVQDAKIESMQYQLQQAFDRIARQEKIIEQFQTVG